MAAGVEVLTRASFASAGHQGRGRTAPLALKTATAAASARVAPVRTDHGEQARQGLFRILRSVILPLSIPAITAVSLFHFFYAWNDFFLPLPYLSGKPDLQTLPIAIQQDNARYVSQPTLIQASAPMTMAVPVVVFFLAQRAFMRGVVVTGVEK